MTWWRSTFNRWRRRCLRAVQQRVVFGERSQGAWRPYTRLSPTVVIDHEEGLVLGDHVYVGPFTVLDASGGITLGDGVQITSHCTLVTHSSHRAMRLLGEGYAQWPAATPRPGWIAGPIDVGAWTFIGPYSLLEANTRLGKGTLVCAGSFVRGEFPDFAILEGRPARIVGDTRHVDERLLAQHPGIRPLYDAWAGSVAR